MSESYSELILKDSLSVIVDAAENMNPIVRESEFKARVLPLIQRPFHHNNLSAYAKYLTDISKDIPYDLTYSLKVVSDEDGELLFSVPALINTVNTTVPTGGTPSAEVVMRSIYAESERNRDINPLIATYLKNITSRKDRAATILTPLLAILKRYGMEIDLSDENQTIEVKKETVAPTKAFDDVDVSFTGEYE